MLVEWANELPTSHFLPIDHHIHGAEADKPNVRTVIHLHGSCVPAEGDGYPENWFVPGKSATYYYYCVINWTIHKKDNPRVVGAEPVRWFVEA
jgi:FtsP/CotA-like multicopper oxidase with cupredoxin domain